MQIENNFVIFIDFNWKKYKLDNLGKFWWRLPGAHLMGSCVCIIIHLADAQLEQKLLDKN